MNLKPPEQYKLCSNSARKKSENCLRQLCYRQITENDIGIYVLNPLLFPKEKEECPYFKTDKKIKLAWGTKNILDDIPNKKASEIKKRASGKIRKNKILSVLQMRETSFPIRPACIHKNLSKTRNRNRNQIRKIHRRL